MGEDEPQHMADHDRAYLACSDRVRRDELEVDAAVGRPEQVGARPKWVGGEPEDILGLEDEEREVVCDAVGERERHERVNESGGGPPPVA